MAMRTNPRFRNRVRHLRESRTALSQLELARALGWSQSSLSAIEENETNPSGELIVRMYDRLGWEVEEILEVCAPAAS